MLKKYYYYIINFNKLYAISLLELMITVAIAIILLSISFNEITALNIETRRREAHTELLKMRTNIEQIAASGFINEIRVFSTIDVARNLQDRQFERPNYTFTIRIAGDSNSYDIIATAREPLATQDPNCNLIILTVDTNAAENRSSRNQAGNISTNCW